MNSNLPPAVFFILTQVLTPCVPESEIYFYEEYLCMKRTLIFGEILCMIFFLFFSSADRRTQFLTSLAGPGMLSLVKQASAKATASEDFSIGTNAGIPVEEPPRIALTFDDGPNARYTPILLDGLKKRNIRASFFLIGENIEGNEDILLQMRRDGHLIGNHTWDHVQLDKIPAEKARLEIEKTNNRIYEASGIYPSYVRPPFGAWIKDMELSVTMLPVFWDVDTLDWQSKNIDSILSIAQKQVHDGSIILMHDGYQTSVDAALKIADLFTEKGYVFVTADQLLLT